ncbi:MAG: hypothetical protein NXH90_03825 [Flavobacteriaceae bacterium]|nr:hypothetical protein [Flavobacteriaceae bacterium]
MDMDGQDYDVFFYNGPVDDLKIRDHPNGDEYGSSEVLDPTGIREELCLPSNIIGRWIETEEEYEGDGFDLAAIMGTDMLERLEVLLQKK